MCDHCAKVTAQKGYAGQVTCRCNGEKKPVSKEKDPSGCCSKKARQAAGGCCMSGCCKSSKTGKIGEGSPDADCSGRVKDSTAGCCGETRK